MIFFLRVAVFFVLSSITLAKEQRFIYDGDVDVYELTFDDNRISAVVMRQTAWLSPWITDPKAPFQIGFSEWTSPSGENMVDKVFMALPLELCTKKPGMDCDTVNPEIPDSAFLRNAARNLKTGDEQVEKLRKLKLPPVLEPVRAYLLLHLNLSLEREKSRYDYLKIGNPGGCDSSFVTSAHAVQLRRYCWKS